MGGRIYFVENDIEADAGEGDTLLDVLRAAGLRVEALCDGKGTCGKCRVRVDGEERLACRTPAQDGMRVELLSRTGGGERHILTDAAGDVYGAPSGKTAIAIDIGTTTVVVKAVDTGSGGEIGVRAFTNPQRMYGADVLSRINNAMDDASLLSGIITEKIDGAVRDLLCKECACMAAPGRVVIAGNTTMIYLLLNLRCRSLGLAPFEPEFEPASVNDYNNIFGAETLDCKVYIYPYISAFVGGDIVSGLVHIERRVRKDEGLSYLFVDMGTNGEIAYRSGERLITTSTAAGPAMEGGNIACGMSGLPGAIYAASYAGGGAFECRTLENEPAVGICGSGVISVMAALLDAGLVSESGAFTDEADRIAIAASGTAQPMKAIVLAESREAEAARGADSAYSGKGAGAGGARVVFTQKDVREFQLAKGAIRAGIEILIKEMGEAPETLYIAGGFGQNIDIEAAIRVGLFPDSLRDRIVFAGNTSLGGCVDACVDACVEEGFGAESHAEDSLAPLPVFGAARAREINLGSHPDFNEKFMEMMLFGSL